MKRLLISGILLVPVVFGQKREDILAIQRDVASLSDQVRQLQKSQDDRLNALQSMIQQAVDSSTRLSSAMTALQRDVDTKLNDQQAKLVAPVAGLGTKVDQMSDDFRSVATNVADLVRRMNALDTKLADIKSALTTIQTPPTAPPPVTGGATGAATGTAPQVPAMSAETSWNNAYRDYQTGKKDLAMSEFMDYVKNFRSTAQAPEAQYYIGYMYYQNEQWQDAAKAFDDVLESWPENSRSQDAKYYKAVCLMKDNQRTAAAKAFRDYLSSYPDGDHAANARQNLRALGMATGSRSSKKRSQ